MTLKAKGKVAFVTGASSGIGLGAAEAFVRAGYATVLADRDEVNGLKAAERLKSAGNCLFVRCDVADEKSVESAIAQSVAAFGRIDAAFNAAGIDGVRAPLVECSAENWHSIMAVNLTGVWHCMRHEIRQMLLQDSGAIVNCASSVGLIAAPLMPAYIAAKHGVVGLTKSAALDYVRHKIRVNAVCPGMIDTPMWRKSITPELQAQLLEHDPIGRLGTPEEIASAVLWLCDDSASFVTGTALPVDGGFIIR
jgi:NAD(P)-dependent dehydrogenase (short-subunit alcohol dehydrogenase family)